MRSAYHAGMRTFHRPLILALGLLGLGGCAPEPGEALFDRYLQTLSQAVQGAPAEPDANPAPLPPRYPRARQRIAAVPEVRGGILELFSLSRCDVTQFIAQRNSILGRHADSASHVALGAAILHRLQQCRAALAAEDELQTRLATLIAEKRPALQALGWNASFGSSAFAQWWSLAAHPVTPDAPAPALAAPVDQLLQAFAASRNGEVEAAQSAFSSAYQVFEQSRAGGAWLLATQRAVSALERAQALLRGAAASHRCAGGRAEHLAQAAQLYQAHVAPHLQALERAMDGAAPALERLWAAQSPAPSPAAAAVTDFRHAVWQGSDSLAERLSTLRHRHDELWRAQRLDCAG